MNNQKYMEINQDLVLKLSTCGRLTIKKEILKLYGLEHNDLLKIKLISVHKNNGKKIK